MDLKQFSTFSIIIVFFISCNNLTINDKISKEVEDKYVTSSLLHPNYDESKIHGIGIFKLGKTLDSTIKNPIFAKEYILDTVVEKDRIRNSYEGEKDVYLISHPKSAEYEFDAVGQKNWCRNKTVYLIPRYTVDSLSINNVILTYYNKVLVSVSCSYSYYLDDAIVAKYGKPDKEYESAEDGFYHSRQWYNQDITAELQNGDTHSFKVELKYNKILFYLY